MRTAEWRNLLTDVNSVVHLAARVHVMRNDAANPLQCYRDFNVAPTVALTRAAAEQNIRHIIYVSSIKVNGEGPTRAPYRSTDPPAPADPYAVSKHEAEKAIAETLRDTTTHFTVVRPPLVYGPGVRANFLRLMRWIDLGIPLPLASVRNTRSLIYVGNLADLITRCLDDDRAAGRTLLASDAEDLSTPELVAAIARALGRPVRLARFPVPMLRGLGYVAGRPSTIQRLCDSLIVDSAPTRELLDWSPPWSVAQGLDATARWYKASER